jgi:hypothetical protein
MDARLSPLHPTTGDFEQTFVINKTLLHGSVVRRRGLDGISGARS